MSLTNKNNNIQNIHLEKPRNCKRFFKIAYFQILLVKIIITYIKSIVLLFLYCDDTVILWFNRLGSLFREALLTFFLDLILVMALVHFLAKRIIE